MLTDSCGNTSGQGYHVKEAEKTKVQEFMRSGTCNECGT